MPWNIRLLIFRGLLELEKQIRLSIRSLQHSLMKERFCFLPIIIILLMGYMRNYQNYSMKERRFCFQFSGWEMHRKWTSRWLWCAGCMSRHSRLQFMNLRWTGIRMRESGGPENYQNCWKNMRKFLIWEKEKKP